MQSRLILSLIVALATTQQLAYGAEAAGAGTFDLVDQVRLLHSIIPDYKDTHRCMKFFLLIDQESGLSEEAVRHLAKLNLSKSLAPGFNLNDQSFKNKLSQIDNKLRELSDDRSYILAKELRICASYYAENMEAALRVKWTTSSEDSQ